MIGQELRLLARESSWLIAIAAYSVLLLYGSVQSRDRVRAQRLQVSASSADYASRWSELRNQAEAARKGGAWTDTRSPSLVGGPIGYAVVWLPVDGLAALSPGESLRRSRVHRISIYAAEPEPPLENPHAAAAGPFDLSFVVIWLLPLALLAASHGAVPASRENGTWGLVVLSSTRPALVAVIRVMLPATALWTLTVVVAGSTVVLSGGTSAYGWLNFSLWSVALAGYAMIWALFSCLVNAKSRNAATAMLASGIVWLTLVWIIPAGIDALVAAVIPPRNRLESHIAAREVQRDLENKLPGMLEQVYARHPEWRPSPETVAAASKPVPGGPASRDSRRVYVPALAAVEATQPLRESLAGRAAAAEDFVRKATLFSPVLALQMIGDWLAGTSSGQFARFETFAKEREKAWHTFFAPRILQLREMSIEDIRQVPSGGEVPIPIDPREVFIPALGIVMNCLIMASLLLGSMRRFLT